MEIKATLQKPYQEKDRLDFIVEQNHKNGYEIKETEQALEAWGLTAEEESEKEKQAHRAELISRLDAIDLKCIRSFRAIQSGSGNEEDLAKLAEYEAQSKEIREQLKDLQEN